MDSVDLFGSVEGGEITLRLDGVRQTYGFEVNGLVAKRAAMAEAEAAADDTGFDAVAALAQAHMRIYAPDHPAAGLAHEQFVEAMVPPAALRPVVDFDLDDGGPPDPIKRSA